MNEVGDRRISISTAQNYGILWCIESGNCLFFLWDNNLPAIEFYLATVYFNKK